MARASTRKQMPVWWSRCRYAALFLLVLAFCSAAISLTLRATTPAPYMDVLTPKLDVYRADASKYDTVFIGTSRTLYHIIPAEIEAGAALAGCDAPSVFNFGVHGMNGAEQDWVIEQVLAASGPELQRIVLEDPLPEARKMTDVTSSRSRYFNAPSQYGARLASIWSFPEGVPKRLFRVGIFGYGTVFDLSGVGRAADKAFPPEQEIIDDTDYVRGERGFEALDEIDFDDIKIRHADFLSRADEFEDALEKYSWGDSPNLNARADYMIGKMRALEARGVQPMFYISPDPMELDRTPQVGKRAAERAPDITVLNYNQPDMYPDLFERAIWHDFSHVGRKGATMLSAKIGEDLCKSGPASGGTGDAIR